MNCCGCIVKKFYDDNAQLICTKHYNKSHRLHCKYGPAIEHSNGDEEYWVNGKLHRLRGPAIDSIDGYQEWWIEGKRHRENGAAVIHPDGYEEFWYNGKQYLEDGICIQLDNLDDEIVDIVEELM